MVGFSAPRHFTIAKAFALALCASSTLLGASAAAQPLPPVTLIAAETVTLLSAESSTAAQGGCPAPSGTATPSKVTAAEQDTILRIHNQARAAANGAPALSPLAWDSSLANAAQGWADIIGPSNHSECHSGSWASGRGENIADFGTVEAGVQYWYNEKAYYAYPTPVVAGTPYLHYTQMVWRATQRIGCGKAASAKYWPGNIALVCRYSPTGNTWGRAPY
jgi:pathogenesis-related protein 1